MARRLDTGDLEDVVANASVSFGRPVDEPTRERWSKRLGAGEVWGVSAEHGSETGRGSLLGQARVLPVYHRFGGQPVPCLDIASVAVPPEHRGRGVGGALMRDVTALGAQEGYGLSLLYPATTAFYRALGWELAGSRTRYRVPTRLVPARGPSLRRADRPTDGAAIERCHERAVAGLSGVAVRPAERWEELAAASFRYVLDDAERPGELVAYALVDHRRDGDGWQFELDLRDWAATTPAGLAALATLVGRSTSFARAAQFVDTTPSRWTQLLAEQDLEIAGGLSWMARGLNLPAAVAARGYPAGLAVAVTVRVEAEPALQGPTGPWRLEIAGGAGRLVDASGADVRLTPQAVGPLFSGFRSATELALLGLLRGPREALLLLDAAFAGPPPVLLDFF